MVLGWCHWILGHNTGHEPTKCEKSFLATTLHCLQWAKWQHPVVGHRARFVVPYTSCLLFVYIFICVCDLNCWDVVVGIIECLSESVCDSLSLTESVSMSVSVCLCVTQATWSRWSTVHSLGRSTSTRRYKSSDSSTTCRSTWRWQFSHKVGPVVHGYCCYECWLLLH